MDKLSPFLSYLANEQRDGEKLPSLAELSQDLGISIASLREQMEVARSLGFVEVRPKTGIRRLPYTFKQTLLQSLKYGYSVDPELFLHFSNLRMHIESSYWYQAVNCLTADQIHCMEGLVVSAQEKLQKSPVQIPHPEHRALHLAIYKNLNNPFVVGILEAYWDLYESVGYSLYTDFAYLQTVWEYHKKMVNYLKLGEYTLGYQALIEHMDLLTQRGQSIRSDKFE